MISRSLVQATQLSPFLVTRLLVGALGRKVIGRISSYLPDGIAIRLQFFMSHGYLPAIRNPKTFSEYINHRKVFDRSPLLVLTSDKFAVRDYVRERCGEEVLIPLLQIVDRVEDINLDQLPSRFVLKPTQARGLVEIIKDKSLIKKDELLVRLSSWIKLNYYKGGREWQYKNIPPRIVAEQALLDANNQPPPDYKLYVFRGRVEMIHVDVERFLNTRRSFFDREWRRLNVSYSYPSAGDQPIPSRLDEMIALAETLGKEFLFTRIDLYQHGSRVYFGEITHTPTGGLGPFNPREFDRALGETLSAGIPIPACYYVRPRPEAERLGPAVTSL